MNEKTIRELYIAEWWLVLGILNIMFVATLFSLLLGIVCLLGAGAQFREITIAPSSAKVMTAGNCFLPGGPGEKTAVGERCTESPTGKCTEKCENFRPYPKEV